jgi:hypothetical protein
MDQMQSYRGEEADAIIVGPTNEVVSIFAVDTRGIVTCHDDVGFASIGCGAWHTKSRLMQFGYANSNPFVSVLVLTYAAKKAAGVAPGVGGNTDIKLVFRDHIEELRPDVGSRLHELFVEKAHSLLRCLLLRGLTM